MKAKPMNAGVIFSLVAALPYLMAGGAPGAGQADRAAALESLIEAERAFSRTSAEKGIREAFLTWLKGDAVVFRPAPVPGRPVYEKMDPANPAVLTWEPEVADVAASGEFGYTSGPYTLRPGPGREPTGHGHYVSIWQKGSDGSWKVFLDAGVPHEGPSSPPATVVRPRPDAVFPELSLEAHRDENPVVAARSEMFIRAVTSRGYRSALTEFATEDVRVYRPGHPPAVGKRGIKELIPKSAGRSSPGPGAKDRRLYRSNFRAELAWSGDLAATFGTIDRLAPGGAEEQAAFLRIWRKGDPSDAWRICLDLEVPVPAEPEKKGP